jgi:hypothetical protein
VKILENLVGEEREYIQNQIIQMEIRQIAESIVQVTHAKKVSSPAKSIKARDHLVTAAESNRPIELDRFLKGQVEIEARGARGMKLRKTGFEQPASKDNGEHLFRIELDPCIGIPPTWIDTKTLRFFNTIRDNIFSSSGIFDVMVP